MATNGSIGGDPSASPDMHVVGLVKGYGAMWPLASEGLHIQMDGDVVTCPQPDGSSVPCSHAGLVAISADNQDILLNTVTELSFPNNVVPDAYDVAAGGRPVIVWEGAVVDHVPPYATQDEPCVPSACSHQPRTAYGFSKDKKTLFLAVVDGREVLGGDGQGMTTRALGTKLKQNGAWWAYNLDGGGSSAMFIQGWWNMDQRTDYPAGIVNVPSDGSVRTVPLQIGVQVVEPRGHLEGTVRKGNAETGAPISGANVTVTYVDDGGATKSKTASTDSVGHYEISDIDAGRQSITVTAPGTKSLTRTKLVAAGDMNRLQIGLAEASSTAASTAIDGPAEPAPDLEDSAGPDTTRVCFGPVPPTELESTDQDPDFPSGGTDDCATAEGPVGTKPDAGATKPDAGVETTGATPASADQAEESTGCSFGKAPHDALPLTAALFVLPLCRRRRIARSDTRRSARARPR